MTAFFSVDVETTGLNPFDRSHQLATVGAQVVHEDGLLGDSWYERLRFRDSWDDGTREWWLTQSDEAKREMFSDRARVAPKRAAEDFVGWVGEVTDHAVFVANPATFDHAWVQRWLTEAGQAMPFDYRTLCLRSADWALDPAAPWGGERNGHRPMVPHHALHDAQAQAMDLLTILKRRRWRPQGVVLDRGRLAVELAPSASTSA